ncbi:hypothetical protein ACE1SV_49760 [Streptomyces sennicomposti]
MDARDARGRFFALPSVLAEAARAGPLSSRAVLRAVFTALLRHTGHRRSDDAAVLVIRNDRDLPRETRTRPRRRPSDDTSR